MDPIRLVRDGETFADSKPPEFSESVQDDGVFLIYETGFPATYQADVWLAGDSQGEIWFKVYEVSTGQRLSAGTVKESTLTRVEADSGSGPSAVRRIEIGPFKMYEGDLEEYYFARIELWFESDAGELVLLSSEVVRVEGRQH